MKSTTNREHMGYHKLQGTDGVNSLTVSMTSGTTAFAEADGGWMYRGSRVHLSAHLILDEGGAWISAHEHSLVNASELSQLGQKIVFPGVVKLFGQILAKHPKARQIAELRSLNNDILRAEDKRLEALAVLSTLDEQLVRLRDRETLAEDDILPHHYIEPKR
jgi:hypothetical protein